MKHLLMAVGVIMLLGASPASAQAPPEFGGYGVEFYNLDGRNRCAIDATLPGVVEVHVLHTGPGSSTGLLFSAYFPECFPGSTWVADELAEPWVSIGTTQDSFGLSIGYGECRPLPIYVGKMVLVASGGTAHCCRYQATHPTGWTYFTAPVLATDCAFVEWTGTAVPVIVNQDPSCLCAAAGPVAVEPTTWGRVKSLYR